MSLNVSGTKYVRVYNPTLKLDYPNVVFASLSSSRKTGNAKVDKETGEIVMNAETGKEVQERAYSNWDARFVGNAFEASKGLRSNDSIDIVNGWIVNEKYKGKDNKEHISCYVAISEFKLSDEVADGDDSDTVEKPNE